MEINYLKQYIISEITAYPSKIKYLAKLKEYDKIIKPYQNSEQEMNDNLSKLLIHRIRSLNFFKTIILANKINFW